jgi:hypothetical protein
MKKKIEFLWKEKLGIFPGPNFQDLNRILETQKVDFLKTKEQPLNRCSSSVYNMYLSNA